MSVCTRPARERSRLLAPVAQPAESLPRARQRPTSTDVERMLEAYIAVEVAGSENERLRRHARAALALGVGLQHMRKANYRVAALCCEATSSVVNTIAIISGRHDPKRSE